MDFVRRELVRAEGDERLIDVLDGVPAWRCAGAEHAAVPALSPVWRHNGVDSDNIKASAGVRCDLTPINTTATICYLKLHDLATAPTCSSAIGLKHV